LEDFNPNVIPAREYYEDLGRAHDDLLRCKDCQKLVTFETIKKLGMCDGCGNKRFVEIKLLKAEEMEKIRSGEIDFDHREEFIKAFEGVA
jgi:DNA-directed RNA polymerase subunit RPC12/RpoP